MISHWQASTMHKDRNRGHSWIVRRTKLMLTSWNLDPCVVCTARQTIQLSVRANQWLGSESINSVSPITVHSWDPLLISEWTTYINSIPCKKKRPVNWNCATIFPDTMIFFQLTKIHLSCVKSWQIRPLYSTMFALRFRAAGKERLSNKGCTGLIRIFSPHMIHHLDNPLIPRVWFRESTTLRQPQRYIKIMTSIWVSRGSGEHLHVLHYTSCISNLSAAIADIGIHQLCAVSRVSIIPRKILRLFSQCRFRAVMSLWLRWKLIHQISWLQLKYRCECMILPRQCRWQNLWKWRN